MQAVVDSLQALAYRMQDLIETRATPQSQLLARELLSQVRFDFGAPGLLPSVQGRLLGRQRCDHLTACTLTGQ
jgi:hypothetical protein